MILSANNFNANQLNLNVLHGSIREKAIITNATLGQY